MNYQEEKKYIYIYWVGEGLSSSTDYHQCFLIVTLDKNWLSEIFGDEKMSVSLQIILFPLTWFFLWGLDSYFFPKLF